MKAKEYAKKFGPALRLDDFKYDPPKTDEERMKILKEMDRLHREAAAQMLYEMDSEVREILKKRNCKRAEAKVAVIREMNDRWNAVAKLVLIDGEPILAQDAFKVYWEKRIPMINVFWNGPPKYGRRVPFVQK